MIRAELLEEEKNELEEKIYNLNIELEKHKEERRLAVQEGDLSENAAYEASNEAISRISKEIASLEDIVGNSVIINTSKIDKSRVNIGTRVKLKEDTGEILELSFVGDNRGCALTGKISKKSLIGGAIFGKTQGSVVKIRNNYGDNVSYEILDIS